MNDLRQAAQQALEALEHHGGHLPWNAFVEVRKDLRAALAQQAEPLEPVAWMYDCGNGGRMYAEVLDGVPGWVPLYAAPPQRKPLSEEEIKDCETQAMVNGALPFEQRVFFARAIERAHGITDPQVADRLARHGIPMPGDPK